MAIPSTIFVNSDGGSKLKKLNKKEAKKAAKDLDKRKKIGSRPDEMKFDSSLNTRGLLADKYKLQGPEKVSVGQLGPQNLEMSDRALSALGERAFAQGESPWLRMQLEKQGLEEGIQRDQAAKAAMQGLTAAQSNLAMSGGLGSGARMRLAKQGAKDMALQQQGVNRDSRFARLSLGLQDDQTKLDLMKTLPGMEMQKQGFINDARKYDIGNQLDVDKLNMATAFDVEKLNKAAQLSALDKANQFKMGKYQSDMSAYAANKQADAMGKPSPGLFGGGGFLGTGIGGGK